MVCTLISVDEYSFIKIIPHSLVFKLFTFNYENAIKSDDNVALKYSTK